MGTHILQRLSTGGGCKNIGGAPTAQVYNLVPYEIAGRRLRTMRAKGFESLNVAQGNFRATRERLERKHNVTGCG